MARWDEPECLKDSRTSKPPDASKLTFIVIGGLDIEQWLGAKFEGMSETVNRK